MGIFSKFLSKIKVSDLLHKPDLDEAENELIATDLGADLARRIIEETRKVKSQTPEEALQSVLSSHLSKKPRQLLIQPGLTTVMVVGVNGTGKTTTVAKLAQKFSPQGLVVLAAADTFRAAAVEQLQTWGKRIGLEVISGKENSDPASVAFDAIEKSRNLSASFLFIDTAGRLHNKSDLMNELGKIKRVIEKVSPVSEVLLVIDATTGQNGLQQAKIFAEAVNVTSLADGRTMAIKISDGNARAMPAITAAALAKFGIDAQEVPVNTLGAGLPVGTIRATF